MNSISADVFGRIILSAYLSFPRMFSGNYTLAEVLYVLRHNSTTLWYIANATDLDGNVVERTVDLYLWVDEYILQATEEPPTSNTTANATEICVPEVTGGELTYLSLIFALIILLVLSFLKTRKRKVKVCGGKTIGRPGLCIPVNLVDSYENRVGFACAFGATTSKCLDILFNGDFTQIFTREEIQYFEKMPSYTSIVWKILAMLVIGVSYYPLFACMASNWKITGYVFGFLYSTMWIIFEILKPLQCPEFAEVIFAVELPTYLCLIYLWVKYLVLLVRGIYRRCRPGASPKDEENEWMTFYKYRYVVKLLEPVPKEFRDKSGDTSLKGKLKGKFYKWRPDFKYSTRVICIYAVSFIGIYMILLLDCWFAMQLLWLRDSIVEGYVATVDTVREWLMIGVVSIFVAAGVAGIHSIILVANMLSWYRGHLLRLQRGEKNFLPKEVFEKKPSAITVATLKYAGFQVAYLCWGAVITTITVTAIVFVIGQQLIMPMVRGNFDTFLWLKLLNLWPAVLISLAFFFFQILMAKYAFLVGKDTTLALDNRRLFHICTYFLFFFNVFLGVVSCLKRILIGALLGVVFLGRTQKSLISRDWELKDPGFNAYVGYLLLEHTHANPVLVTFCQLLVKTLNDRADLEMSESFAETNHIINSSSSNNQVSIELNDSSSKRMNRTVRNRWQLLLTLHNNPSLKEHRRSELFVQKSPLAAFGVMIKKGMMPYRVDEEKEKEHESGVEDIKL